MAARRIVDGGDAPWATDLPGLLRAAPASLTLPDDPLAFPQFQPLWQHHCTHCSSCADGVFPDRNSCPAGHVIRGLLAGVRLPLRAWPPPVSMGAYASMANTPGSHVLVGDMVDQGFVARVEHPLPHLHPLSLIVDGLGKAPGHIPAHQLPKARVVIDLSVGLNRALHRWPIRFASLDAVLPLIERDSYLAVADIASFFMKIPIFPGHARLQGFELHGSYYYFRSLAFGASVGPQIASAVSAMLLHELRHAGVSSFMSVFIDDILLADRRLAATRRSLDATLHLLSRFGFPAKPEKVSPPARQAAYLGALIHTRLGTVSLPTAKRLKFHSRFLKALISGSITKTTLKKLAGTASYISTLLPTTRHMASPFFDLLSRLRRRHQRRRIDASARSVLMWWLALLSDPGRCTTALAGGGRRLVHMRSDASGTHGWGYQSSLEDAGAMWPAGWEALSSVAKEVLPLLVFIARNGAAARGALLVWHCDSAASVAAVNAGRCEEGVASDIAALALALAEEYGVVVLADWAPREHMRDVDLVSKQTTQAWSDLPPRSRAGPPKHLEATAAARVAPAHPDAARASAEAAAEAAAAFSSALAPGTIRAYDRALEAFHNFCISRNWPTSTGDASVVAAFVADWCTRHKSTSAGSVVTGLMQACRIRQLPTISAAERTAISQLSSAIKRAKGDQPQRKQPITMGDMHLVLPHLNLDDVVDLQFWAGSLLSHQGLLRVSELLRARWSDLQWRADAVVLYVSNAKTHREPRPVVFGPRGDSFCVMRTLAAYHAALRALPGGTSSPYIMAGLSTVGGSTTALPYPVSADAWRHSIKARFVAAGIPPSLVSAHSFRAGGMTDLRRAGAPDTVILKQGRWASASAIPVYDRPSLHDQAALARTLPTPARH